MSDSHQQAVANRRAAIPIGMDARSALIGMAAGLRLFADALENDKIDIQGGRGGPLTAEHGRIHAGKARKFADLAMAAFRR